MDLSPLENFNQVLKYIDAKMRRFYDLRHGCSVDEHLIHDQHLIPDPDLRAATLVSEEEQGEIALAVYFNDEITQHLNQFDLFCALDIQRLDALCVLIEELSHFHLLCDRASKNRKTSRLELEWQAEIDKLLFATLVIFDQQGYWLFERIERELYHRAKVISKEEDLYRQANQLANEFWKNISNPKKLTPQFFQNPSFLQYMQQYYQTPWHEKKYRQLGLK